MERIMKWIFWAAAAMATFFGLNLSVADASKEDVKPRETKENVAIDAATQIKESERWARNGYLEDAARLLERMERANPGLPEAHILRARVEIARGAIGPAFEAMAAVNPDHATVEGRAILSALARAELSSLLDSGSIEVRAAALEAIGESSSSRAVERMLKLPIGSVPSGGGRLVDLVGLRRPALRPLFELLSVQERRDLSIIGAAGVLALGDDMRESLEAALRGSDPGDAILAADLARRGRLPFLLEVLRERSKAKDESGVAALGAVATLTTDRGERGRCLRSLERTAQASSAARSSASRRATAMLSSVEGDRSVTALHAVRSAAVTLERRVLASRGLAERGDDGGLSDLLTWLESPHEDGAGAEAGAVGALGRPEAVPKLRALIRSSSESAVRGAAAIALAAYRREDCALDLIGELRAAHRSGDERQRLSLAIAMHDTSAIPTGLTRPDLAPAFEVEVPRAIHASRAESAFAMAEASAYIVEVLAAEHEACHVDVMAAGIIQVSLSSELTHERVAVLGVAIAARGYSVIGVDREPSVDGCSSAESDDDDPAGAVVPHGVMP